MAIGWVALTEAERNNFLQEYDPNKAFDSERLGFNIGWHDADGDSVKDTEEKTSFFKEGTVGNQVYVLTLSANGDGTYKSRISLKNADGSLTELLLTAITGSSPLGWFAALHSDKLNLSADAGNSADKPNLEYLITEFNNWVSKRAGEIKQPTNFNINGSFFNSESNTGWTKYYGTARDKKTFDFLEKHSRSYDPTKQGQIGQDGIGGWGGYIKWQNVASGKGGNIKYEEIHHVNSYAAYEIALSGKTYTNQQIWNGDHKGWAEKNNIVIGKVDVDGKETMGFTASTDGYRVMFYWDQAAQCNRIGCVYDSSGKNVTSGFLAQQTTNTFGKDWPSIKAALNMPSTTRLGGAGTGTYGDGFKPEYTGGSVEAPTPAETEQLIAFKQKWAAFLDANGRLTALPTGSVERMALLADLKLLNASDVLTLFAGKDKNNISSGLALLNDLVQGGSPSDTNWLAMTAGKMMYLAGRELGRNGGKDGESEKEKTEFYQSLQKEILPLIGVLSGRIGEKEFDVAVQEKVLFHFMLGLRNYTEQDGVVNPDMLKPANLVLYLADQLAEAANMNDSTYTANNARVLAGFMADVVQCLAMFIGLAGTSGLNSDDFKSGAGHYLLGGVTEDGVQRLLGLAFGRFVSHAYDSSAGQKVFTEELESRMATSRKLQEELMQLFKLLNEGIAKAHARIYGSN